MRTYEKTHPWLSFRLDLSRATPFTWVCLGESQSKCVHLAHIPLKPDIARQLHQIYLAKGVRATTAIEGNTLSEKEVLAEIEGRLQLPPSKEYLAREVRNIVDACNRTLQSAVAGELPPLNRELIEQYNAAVLRDLPPQDGVVPGEIRRHSVGVGGYRGAPAEECGHLLDRLCDWLNSDEFKRPPEEYQIVFAILRAVLAHLYIAWIHPFGDGNGRTARLVEFRILIEAGVPSPAAHLLSNHYNETRAEYYRALDKSSRAAEGPLEFVHYAVRGFVDQLKEQLKVVFRHVLDVSWRSYVEDVFENETGEPSVRQRHLALDLSPRSDAVPIPEIRILSPRMERHYRRKTEKTIRRDLKALSDKSLINVTPAGVTANSEIILSLTPPNADKLRQF